MKGLRQEDMVNQDLITELRKEFSMTHDDFYMVLTDADMRVKVRTSKSESRIYSIYTHKTGLETRGGIGSNFSVRTRPRSERALIKPDPELDSH